MFVINNDQFSRKADLEKSFILSVSFLLLLIIEVYKM